MTDAIAAQFAAMGRRAPQGKRGEDVYEVWDSNWPAVRAFLALETQWRTASLTTLEGARIVRTGLDYGVVPAVLRLLGIKRRRRVFAQVRLLEAAAIAALAEAR